MCLPTFVKLHALQCKFSSYPTTDLQYITFDFSIFPTKTRKIYECLYEVCPESNENGIPTLPTAVGGEAQV
jgi:hypothetical protein